MVVFIYNPSTWEVVEEAQEVKASLCYSLNLKLAWATREILLEKQQQKTNERNGSEGIERCGFMCLCVYMCVYMCVAFVCTLSVHVCARVCT